MPVRTYDPKLVTLSIAGVPIGGFIDGEGILIAREADNTTDVSGTDDEISVILNGDVRHTATIALAQTSASNTYLSGFVPVAGLPLPTFPFDLQDLNGVTFCQGTGWIQRAPDVGFSKDISDRSWAVRVAVTGKLVGGSPAVA